MHCNILQRALLVVALYFSVSSIFIHSQHVSITVGLIFSEIGGLPLHYWHFKPACDIAIATVNENARNGHYLNISLSSVLGTTDISCGRPLMKSSGVASDLYNDHNIKAIFGPPCSDETERVAEIAAYWNIPILSGLSTASILNNKDAFRTLTRTSSKISTLVDFIVKTMDEFEWQAVAVVYTPDDFYRFVYEGMDRAFSERNISIHSVPVLSSEVNATLAIKDAIARGRSK